MSRNVVVLLDSPEGQKMVRDACDRRRIVYSVFEELVQEEVERVGRKTKHGLADAFDDILDRIEVEKED